MVFTMLERLERRRNHRGSRSPRRGWSFVPMLEGMPIIPMAGCHQSTIHPTAMGNPDSAQSIRFIDRGGYVDARGADDAPRFTRPPRGIAILKSWRPSSRPTPM
ncbi:MAG: hypothetical protein CMJ22_04110 [Phycisphaerae bacterium]|nr:hypothetical protein [Phycisphaerae bacterium]